MSDMREAGMLWLVVGPSGAGKDSLLDGARAALAGDPSFRFPTRDITRDADAGGEAHNAVGHDDFHHRRANGAYALSWDAHGLHYGVPDDIRSDIAAGRHVVVNVSRGVIDEARRRFPRVRVLSVTVPRDVLAERLNGRGRETADEIARRLDRAGAFAVEGDDVVAFVNDRPLAESVAAFVSLLRSAD